MRLPEQIVAEWIHDVNAPVLLALDAPLGWPAAMSASLPKHHAGDSLEVDANALFRRETDRFIARTFRKTPLDVGADRIARTAHWAVGFLGRLRKRLGREIPLAWSPSPGEPVSAIEVYPAATLLAHGAQLSGYKAVAGAQERSAIYALLEKQFACSDECASAVASAHLIDAAICALAGADFIKGKAVAPEDRNLAEREGWIWARSKA